MNGNGKSPGVRTGRNDGACEAVARIPFKLPKWRRQLQTWRHRRDKAATSLAGDAAGRAADKIAD
jgi:hypothetical protein